MFPYTEEPWDDCLETLKNGVSAGRLKWDLPMRPEALLWAAETEGGGENMLERAQGISKVLSGPR